MNRRIDEFGWHCGPHPCDHDYRDVAESPKAWRYSVIARDFAYSLTICASSGQLALHRAFVVSPETVNDLIRCDLNEGRGCVVEVEKYPDMVPAAGVHLGPGLMFWSRHAAPGQREQPEKFWRALERAGRAAAKVAKAARAHVARCPRCLGAGVVTFKPKKEEAPDGVPPAALSHTVQR
jgi:hypothetical protein